MTFFLEHSLQKLQCIRRSDYYLSTHFKTTAQQPLLHPCEYSKPGIPPAEELLRHGQLITI